MSNTIDSIADFTIHNMLRTFKVELCDVGNGKCTAKVTGSINLFGAVKRFAVLRKVSLPARRKGDYQHKMIWFEEASNFRLQTREQSSHP